MLAAGSMGVDVWCVLFFYFFIFYIFSLSVRCVVLCWFSGCLVVLFLVFLVLFSAGSVGVGGVDFSVGVLPYL